jgi:hypothetical protein
MTETTHMPHLEISRYKGGRNWAVREAGTGSLVVVTLYRKGAEEVVRRLTGTTPEKPKRKRQSGSGDFAYRAGGAS